MNALLILDKPQGLSSHSAVHRIRKITGEERVGHAGTLDPMATGVLLILLGSTVRLSEYIVDHDKKYRATVKLGVETDTYDATGNVIAEQTVNLAPDEIEHALQSFVGKLNQVPPAHSAIQVQGTRAYKLARQGVAVELEPRAVEIYSIEVLRIAGDKVEFDVHCSKGTYIRSLAHDLGAKLGVGAHLSALRRLASGDFTIESALTLGQVSEAVANNTLADHLLPMDLAVQHLDAIQLDAATAHAVQNGQFIAATANLTTPLVRAYDEHQKFIAILERISENQLKPKKVLVKE
ncbi:MAG TPA: tRNA pseudouridine(55) synthase TruB [Anaerolineae bacterium]|nr:tRNA pseudouridine(55) synthase TruB [Anaerolineae bacterium]